MAEAGDTRIVRNNEAQRRGREPIPLEKSTTPGGAGFGLTAFGTGPFGA